MFIDLMPDVALVCAEQADRQGNLYTGPNTGIWHVAHQERLPGRFLVELRTFGETW